MLNFLKGIKTRFKKETQLTASINKLVLQSELFNSHDIHGYNINSAVQASLLSDNAALSSRIESRSGSAANSPMKTHGASPSGAIRSISPLGTPQRLKRKSLETERPATFRPPRSTPRGLHSVHPSPAAPVTDGDEVDSSSPRVPRLPSRPLVRQ